ncbi:MAG: MFS transporter [Chloroflexales bacterium]|nr:MFS transporter [Chloroflexales bacterium]
MWIRRIVENRNAVLLVAGQVISKAGDQLANVAFLWLITTLTGSAAALGSVMTALILPNIVFRLIGGVITDRFNQKYIMIVADILRSVMVFLLAILALNGALNMGYFLIIAAMLGVGAALFDPAYRAVVPRIVEKDQLLRFNSTLQSANQGVGILVPAGAGLVIAAIGIPAALGLNGVSFLLSALSILLISSPLLGKRTHQAQSVVTEWKEGFRIVFANPFMRLIFLAIGLINFADALVVIYPVHIKDVLGLGVAWYGFFNAAVMAGLFSTNVFYMWIGKRIRTSDGLLFGALAQGLGLLVFGLFPNPFVGLCAFYLFGVGMAGFGTATVTLLQQEVEQAFLGRVFSLYGIFALSLMPFGYFVAGITANRVGTGAVIVSAGVMMIATAFLLLRSHPIGELRRA